MLEQPGLERLALDSLLFRLKQANLIEYNAGWHNDPFEIQDRALLLVLEGSGDLRRTQWKTRLCSSRVYWLNPGNAVQIVNECENLRLYLLRFDVFHIGEDGPAAYRGAILPDRHESVVHPFSRLTELADQLTGSSTDIRATESFRRQVRFQELLSALFEEEWRDDDALSATQAVESTVSYMQSHYMHAITVKQLAQLGNIPQWQYSSLFQERMGMKPLDYLTELRIGHAKEWLLQSDEPLREIARRVGFTDEYYFNRRFRHTTGMTPRQYSVSMSRKVRIKDWTGHEVYIPRKPERVIYHGESLGDLCALGIRAVGGSAFFANSSLLEHEPQLEMQDIGMPINPGKAEALKPDLIILASADEDQYRALSRIAPTVTHNTHAPLEHRLLTLGQWLGRQREAELWLAAYHERVSAMWRKLHAVIDAGDTASVFIYEHGRRLFVMGTAGLSSSLYHPSGFQATSRIREIVEAVRGFAEISPASLPDYAGDHIFMLLSTNEASRQAAEDMMGSDLWRKLSAVRAGRAYVMEADLWNHGDALSRQKLIQALPRMLGNIS